MTNLTNQRNYSLLRGKSILLCMPDHFNIYEEFSYSIKKLGLDLQLILPPNTFYYKRKKEKIINFLRKTFLLDKRYKEQLRRKFNVDYYIERTKDIQKKSIDYVLIIRPDLIPKEAIEHLLGLGKETIAYQWDGLNRFPKIFDYIPKFDKFYIFDFEDYERYRKSYSNLKLSQNFFFEEQQSFRRSYKAEGVFYRGSYSANRIDDIEFIVDQLSKYDILIDVQLLHYKNRKPIVNNKKIGLFDKQINFADYLEKVKNARILLDFKANEHNGLSLRFFEALKYEKKIITNNLSVIDYDFYNPNNIFILHKDNIENLKNFIYSEYEKLPIHIVENYSFKAWLYDCLLG